MRELLAANWTKRNRHLQFLTTASIPALLVSICSVGWAAAQSDSSDRPQLWIELGGQLGRLDEGHENFTPPFLSLFDEAGLESPSKFERPPRYSMDEYGKLSFQPHGSDWVVSASVQYGRSNSKKNIHQETHQSILVSGIYSAPHTRAIIPSIAKFDNTEWTSDETHTVLDFQVGKDVGLGLFGSGSSAKVDFGVRFAQFSSRSNAETNADPTIRFPNYQISFFQLFAKYQFNENVYWSHEESERDFRGVGPSISLQGSTQVVGRRDDTNVQFDWAVNAAVLFGRQKSRGHHQSSSVYVPHYQVLALHDGGAPTAVGPYVMHNRSESVTVPNVGGSLGFSLHSGDAKVSFGYHADLFIGAMDAGVDVRKRSNILLHGPYASVSVGLGG